MVYFLTLIIVLAIAVPATLFIINWGRDRLDANRKARVVSDRALGKAERALRTIANSSHDEASVLEAQIALDEISTHHEKEINQ